MAWWVKVLTTKSGRTHKVERVPTLASCILTSTCVHTHTHELDMVAQIYNPSTQQAEAKRISQVQGQSSLYRQFYVIQSYTTRPHLKNK